ncbi:MAG TPA: hypothetical protein PL156_08390 [Rhodoglobus sp.]|nr:hypothetical protein [Rhodoglobus sp.]
MELPLNRRRRNRQSAELLPGGERDLQEAEGLERRRASEPASIACRPAAVTTSANSALASWPATCDGRSRIHDVSRLRCADGMALRGTLKCLMDQNVVEECVVYPVHELEQLLSQ